MHECSNIIKKKSRKSQEPYRAYLRPIRDKLKITQKEIALFLNEKKPINNVLIVQSINEIINPLTVQFINHYAKLNVRQSQMAQYSIY